MGLALEEGPGSNLGHCQEKSGRQAVRVPCYRFEWPPALLVRRAGSLVCDRRGLFSLFLYGNLAIPQQEVFFLPRVT